MPTSSHTATLVFPSLPPTILLGLDTLAVTPSPQFLGVTQVPAGWHFAYAGAHSALSIRSGYWFYVPAGSPWLRIFRWNADVESLEAVEDAAQVREWTDRVRDTSNAEIQRRLLPYDFDPSSVDATAAPREAVDLEPLTGHIDIALLNHLTASSQGLDGLWMLSTSSSAPEDRDEIPGLDFSERTFTSSTQGAVLGEERELHFLGIDLKRTWLASAVGRERTIDARDRSAALERVLAPWTSSSSSTSGSSSFFGHALLGELQVCFFAVLLLANWSALQEWKRALELALTSRRAVREQPRFFAALLRTLAAQLQRCADVEGGLFDVQGEGAGFLQRLLRQFRATLRGLVEEVEADADADTEGKATAATKDRKTPSAKRTLAALRQVTSQMTHLDAWVSEHWAWTLDARRLLRTGVVQLEDGEEVELRRAGPGFEALDAEEERGEYAPVVVDLEE